MKKITFFLIVMAAALCGMQASAQLAKGPARSAIYPALPPNFIALGTYDNPNHLYYSTQEQHGIPVGYVNGLSIIGEVDGKYYSSTYAKLDNESDGIYSNPGAGFIAAMSVDGILTSPVICNCQTGTSSNSVNFSARVERAGEYAARIVYTLTNNAWLTSRTVSLGVYADIMIGDNDSAAVYCLRNDQGKVYGLDMKYKRDEDAQPGEKVPVFTAIFGAGSGVTPVDDWWFGQYTNNYKAANIVGDYNNVPDVYTGNQWVAGTVEDEHYKEEGGSYDSGMGFCWKNITLSAGESVELSFLVSVSEIDIDEPEPDPEAEYHVEVYNTEAWNDLAADHPAHVWGYYKHPFDWTGHMEYMVDGDRGTGEWTAIPGELTPNSEFDLPFNLNFNPDVTDIHTLKLRIVDNQGNDTYLTELDQEWEDIRTIPLTVDPETHYYDGTPKSFVVSVGGVFDYPFEYTEPGTYDFSIYGDYDMGTIGVNTIEFSIVRRQAGLNVQVPEDCVYDGNEHPATATCDGDGTVIITYKDSEGNVSTDAPVEPGTYEVFVEVTDGETTDGIENASYGSFTIDKRQTDIDVDVPEDCIYDGNEHAAIVTVVDGDGEVTVTYKDAEGNISTEAPVEPGTYEVYVAVAETDHYYGIENTKYGEFTISKKQAELVVIVPEDCVYDGNEHAATVNYNGDGDVIVTYVDETGVASTDAPTEPGTYEVFVEVTEGDYFNGIENTKYGEFTIDRRPCEYVLDLPEARNKFEEGKTYGATATLPEGSGNYTITYYDITGDPANPVLLPGAPSAVGKYLIVFYVDDSGEYYYGLDEPIIVWQYEIYAENPSAVNELTIGTEDNGAWYTIDGRRVAAPTERGIYIHNGKKYYVK